MSIPIPRRPEVREIVYTQVKQKVELFLENDFIFRITSFSDFNYFVNAALSQYGESDVEINFVAENEQIKSITLSHL